MRNYIGKRLLQLIPVLFGITLLTFVLMNISSADAIDVMEQNTGSAWSEEQKEAARAQLGLDKPLPIQYLNWLGGVLTGDMGESYISGQPVGSAFMSKLPATVFLAAASLLLAVAVSLPLGILAAVRQNRFADYAIRIFSFIGNSLPGFFVALLLMYIFSLKLGWFPVMANHQGLRSVVLPAVTLALAMSSKYARQVRAMVLEEMNKDYVLGARARGIRESRILFFSVLKVCMPSIVTLLAVSAGSLLGGTAVVGTIFMWDGVGKMAVDAILTRDYPVIQAYVMWMAVIYVAVNLAADIICHYLRGGMAPASIGGE